jgi:hypothetical protein
LRIRGKMGFLVTIKFKDNGIGSENVTEIKGRVQSILAMDVAIRELQEFRDNKYREFREKDYEDLTEKEKEELAFEEKRRMDEFCTNYERYKKFIFEGKMEMK